MEMFAHSQSGVTAKASDNSTMLDAKISIFDSYYNHCRTSKINALKFSA